MALPLPGSPTRPPAPPAPGQQTAAGKSNNLPPPPKVAPASVSAAPAFEFTDEDVEAAVEDLLSLLPPKVQVDGRGPPRAAAVVGPKGGKTIASIAVKLPTCPGLPRPKGSIPVVMFLDNQAEASWQNFLVENGWAHIELDAEGQEKFVSHLDAESNPTFIPLGRPYKRYKARHSQSDPACSAYVRDVVLRFMRRMGERGDVGLCVFDGYGDYTNRYGNYIAAYVSGFSSPLKLEGTQWTPRREFFADTIAGGLGAVCLGGWFVFNGPEGGLDNEEKDPSKLKKRMKKEGFTERQPPSKWLLYRENSENVSAIIQTDVAIDLTQDTPSAKYSGDVWDGRLAHLGFTTGNEVDLTNKNISAFLALAKKQASPPQSTLIPAK